MADPTLSRPGQINGAGDAEAIFRSVFPGEIIKSYNATNIMMGLHVVRTIASGKSADFPALGRAVANYHVPGTEILGQVIKGNERTILIDALLESSVWIAKIDDAMLHFDVRGEYAKQLGEALANKSDKQLLQTAILTARAAATISGQEGGSILKNTAAATDAEVLAGMAFLAAQTFDEKFVSPQDRHFLVKPAQYYMLVQNKALLNRDWGGAGSLAQANLPTVANMTLHSTVNMPSTNIASAEDGTANVYHGDFSDTVAVAFHRSAIGTVKLLDLAVEKEYWATRKSNFVSADYAMGHGGLRPECAIEFSKAA